MKHPRFYWLITCLFSVLISCQRARVPFVPQGTGVRLEAGEVLVTEAWFKLEILLSKKDLQVKFFRKDSLLWQKPAAELDTLVYDSGLLPAHSYRYHAELWQKNERVDKSAPLTITTLDTTSHDFEWEVSTFYSRYGSARMNDVAIVNENDIWVVGAIYSDTAQPWLPYNAVHWNGEKWELKRIAYWYNGQPFYHPLSFAFSFAGKKVWFGGNGIVEWTGQQFRNVEVPISAWANVAINKLWGSSLSSVYIAGNAGHIAHYDGSRWQRIESGTELPFQDIWGSKNMHTGEVEVLAVASDLFHGGGIRLVRLQGGQAQALPDSGLPLWLRSLWFEAGRVYYVVGDGIYRSLATPDNWKRITGLPPIAKDIIRGQGANDIFIAGSFGLLMHYNGITWHDYRQKVAAVSTRYWSLDYKGDVVVAVAAGGGPFGYVVVGRRK